MLSESKFEEVRGRRSTEAVLLGASLVGGVIALYAFVSHGLTTGVLILGLSLLLFGLSRLVDLGIEILRAVDRLEAKGKAPTTEAGVKE